MTFRELIKSIPPDILDYEVVVRYRYSDKRICEDSAAEVSMNPSAEMIILTAFTALD